VLTIESLGVKANGETTIKARLLLDAISPDCCVGCSQCCISDKTAHTSAFDFGSPIDKFTFVVSKVNESFFPKARSGSPTRRRTLFFGHSKMVTPKFLLVRYSLGPCVETFPRKLDAWPAQLLRNEFQCRTRRVWKIYRVLANGEYDLAKRNG